MKALHRARRWLQKALHRETTEERVLRKAEEELRRFDTLARTWFEGHTSEVKDLRLYRRVRRARQEQITQEVFKDRWK